MKMIPRNKDRRVAKAKGPEVPRTARNEAVRTSKERRRAASRPPPPRPAPRPAPAPQRAAPAPTREERILAAMAGLDPFNPEHYTKKGTPRADAVNDASGLETTAAERAAAWENIENGRTAN